MATFKLRRNILNDCAMISRSLVSPVPVFFGAKKGLRWTENRRPENCFMYLINN